MCQPVLILPTVTPRCDPEGSIIGAMKVRTQTNLVKRGSVWYFRKKVPQDLQGHYRRESIRKSLREFPALADARREAARLAAQFDAEFGKVRQSLQPAKAVILTASMVPAIAKALERHILVADEEIRGEGMDEDTFTRWESETATTLAEVSKAYARGDSSPINAALEEWLWGLGIEAPAESAEFKTLRREFLKAHLKALQAKTSRNRGEIVDTPEGHTLEALQSLIADPAAAPVPAKASRGGPWLSDVVDYWKGVSEKSHRTTGTADTMVKEFTRLHGDIPLSDITKAHFVALRDDQLSKVKAVTVQARFNLLKAAYTVCLEDDKFSIKDNPLQYVKIRNTATGEKERDAFTSDQLQTLFDSPVFTVGERPLGGRGAAAFWCPLIALFTGARLDEILSLRTDGLQVVEGVPVFHFMHRPELGQKLKGKGKNARRVPVHPELIRLGLLDFHRDVSKLPAPANGAGWLFRDIDRSDKVRNHSSAWGAWFGRYLTACKVKNPKITFHSFRHTFKHFCRASGIAEDQQDAMTGHTTAEVSRRYGSCFGYPVGALSTAMQSLAFGGLDLSRVRAC